jgi:hypothetical protein
VREAEQIEGSWTRARIVLTWPAKWNQSRLFRVKRETVPTESLREYFHHAMGVALQRECDDEIVRVADQEGPACQPGFHFLFEPHVEHVVEIDIRQER